MTTGQYGDRPPSDDGSAVPENAETAARIAAEQALETATASAEAARRAQRIKIVELLDSTDSLQSRQHIIEQRVWILSLYLSILIAVTGLYFGYFYRSYIFETPRDWILHGLLWLSIVSGMGVVLAAWRKSMSNGRALFETAVSLFQSQISHAWHELDVAERDLLKARNDALHEQASRDDEADSIWNYRAIVDDYVDDEERGNDDA
ncbi:hypothetical protein AL755_20160 [Arthrobacter sp. ERGS1:01]|uniref:hypothetical protein n=1 Tax=Arthrobacter sp. ERGS1:01 TaxID=1704044 RepID=UPI0006B42F89|nr:hypothetical protein [Arthrobacter sp. ERGS1:01]ALE07254.1 hypothetical protein AL755_20160 [Arthrobacter sp. ERGS1:01]